MEYQIKFDTQHHGSDSAPIDWDGGFVLYASGHVGPAGDWQHLPAFKENGSYIIAYNRKKVDDDLRARSALATEKVIDDLMAIAAKEANESLAERGVDYVTVRKMTEPELTAMLQDNISPWDIFLKLGLIKVEETRAEKFKRETGHDLTPGVIAALEFSL